MEHVLQKIKETEKKAHEIIAEAKKNAVSIRENMKNKMEKEERDLVEYKKEKVAEYVKKAQSDFEKEKEAIDKEWEELSLNIKKNADTKKDKIIEHIINEVVK